MDARGQQQIWAEAFPLNAGETQSFGSIQNAVPGNGARGLHATDDHGRIKKGDAIGKTTPDKARIDFATAFHEDARNFFLPELFQHPSNIDLVVTLRRPPNAHVAFECCNLPGRSAFADYDGR